MNLICQIPSSAGSRIPLNLVAQDAVHRMGGSLIRTGVGMNSIDLLNYHPDKVSYNLHAVLERALKYKFKMQWELGGMPLHAGEWDNMPDESNWPQLVKIEQAAIDQLHAADPNCVFGLSNEIDGQDAPTNVKTHKTWAETYGWPDRSIPHQWFRWMVYRLDHVNYRSHRLCISHVGNSIQTMKSYKYRDQTTNINSEGRELALAIRNSGGQFKLNIYPNITPTYTKSVSTFNERFFGTTLVNAKNLFTASVISDAGAHAILGETGVRSNIVDANKVPLTPNHIFDLRQGQVDECVRIGVDMTLFEIVATDSTGAYLAVIHADGSPVIKDMNLASR